MSKTLLLTGATDGIGLETARALVAQGHRVLVTGRNPTKLDRVVEELSRAGAVERYVADFSRLGEVAALAAAVADKHDHLDAIINNAGIFAVSTSLTDDGLDVRFAVNTLAPYILTQRLLSRMDASGRVVNVSSAAQQPVDLEALDHHVPMPDMAAYAQSKLALTAWSRQLALQIGADGPVVVAVNPGSMLGSKMVKEAFRVDGHDLQIGAEILVRATLDAEFASARGQYFDNDARAFGPPHGDVLNDVTSSAIVATMEAVITRTLG
ncbi:MAG: SDR family NAD(P)-dependent oxidoreductase [Myxococcota bacterium]